MCAYIGNAERMKKLFQEFKEAKGGKRVCKKNVCVCVCVCVHLCVCGWVGGWVGGWLYSYIHILCTFVCVGVGVGVCGWVYSYILLYTQVSERRC
jgi:hypothetical protein